MQLASIVSSSPALLEMSQPPLETEFHQEATTIDFDNVPDFGLYLTPNEGGVLSILPHLPKTRGLEVATGTERAFFLLALRGLESEGLVVRDIHPYVKAYVDFNTLLLRIANDRKHYVELSTLSPNVAIGSPEYQQKIKEIRTITESAHLPPRMKQYYLDYLDVFAEIYFRETKHPNYWRGRSEFNGVKYYENDTLFNRLQQHAKSGNIIATVGDIADLSFLDQRCIATLDISNIPDYCILNIQTRSEPRLVTTRVSRVIGQTKYASSPYHTLTDPQKIDEIEELLEICRQVLQPEGVEGYWSGYGMDFHSLLKAGNPTLSEVNSFVYSESLLNALRQHKNRYWAHVRGRWVDFSPEGNFAKADV